MVALGDDNPQPPDGVRPTKPPPDLDARARAGFRSARSGAEVGRRARLALAPAPGRRLRPGRAGLDEAEHLGQRALLAIREEQAVVETGDHLHLHPGQAPEPAAVAAEVQLELVERAVLA